MTTEISFTSEMLDQAKSAPSAAALQTQAQENGTPMTAEQAATYYAQLHPETGAISDEELDNVAGGCLGYDPRPEKCRFCGWTDLICKPVGKRYGWACCKCGRFDKEL